MERRRPTKPSWSDVALPGNDGYVLFSLQRLAALRAKQGDDAAADGLYEEAIACSFNPSVSADARVGQAAVARRLGDLERARGLLDAAGRYYRDLDHPGGHTGVLAGLAWWALSAGNRDEAMAFAADAAKVASLSGDPAVQLLAATAVAAVKALADPTHHNIGTFLRSRSSPPRVCRTAASTVSPTSPMSLHSQPASGLGLAERRLGAGRPQYWRPQYWRPNTGDLNTGDLNLATPILATSILATSILATSIPPQRRLRVRGQPGLHATRRRSAR